MEQEKSRDETAEFSGFRRQWWLLGWVVRSQLAKRERKGGGERRSKTVKKRKRECDEKREKRQDNVI